MKPIPRIGQTAIDGVEKAGAVVTSIHNISDTYLKPLKTFNSIVSTVAKIALGVLTAVSQVLISQTDLVNKAFGLFDSDRGVWFLWKRTRLRNLREDCAGHK